MFIFEWLKNLNTRNKRNWSYGSIDKFRNEINYRNLHIARYELIISNIKNPSNSLINNYERNFNTYVNIKDGIILFSGEHMVIKNPLAYLNIKIRVKILQHKNNQTYREDYYDK